MKHAWLVVQIACLIGSIFAVIHSFKVAKSDEKKKAESEQAVNASWEKLRSAAPQQAAIYREACDFKASVQENKATHELYIPFSAVFLVFSVTSLAQRLLVQPIRRWIDKRSKNLKTT